MKNLCDRVKVGEIWFNRDTDEYYKRINHKDVVSCSLCPFDNTGPCNAGQICSVLATHEEIEKHKTTLLFKDDKTAIELLKCVMNEFNNGTQDSVIFLLSEISEFLEKNK